VPLPQIKSQTGKAFSPKAQTQSVPFANFPLGINRLKNDKQLEPGELDVATNFKYNDFGRLETREGVAAYTSTITTDATAIKQIVQVFFEESAKTFGTAAATFGSGYTFGSHGSIQYIMLVDANYELYYIDATGAPTSIGTLEGDATVIPFAGHAVVLDGSYIKYWDGSDLSLAYDDGTGSDGYMFDYTDDDQDTTRSLNGTVTACGGGVTISDWDSGYTIPTKELRCDIAAVGSPTGNIYAKVYNSARTSVLATSTAMDSASLSTHATEITFAFATGYDMVPSTNYFFSVEYENGDADNYINVYKDTTATIEYYYEGSWKEGTGTPLFGLKPGRPPKGSFGVTRNNRMFFKDPDSPGWVRYTNVNSIFDYSTSFGGGYIGLIDDNANNFKLGGLQVLYDDLYAIGEPQSPYLVKILVTSPDVFAQETVNHNMYSNRDSIVSTGNDIWFANKAGVFPLSGTQLYGDLRESSAGDPVLPTIEDNWDVGAFAVYDPANGQYLLKLNGYDKILVCHTKRPVPLKGRIQYPWTEYELKDLTPSAFAYINDTFYIGCTNGYLYTLSADVNDDGNQPDYSLKTGVTEVPFGAILATEYYLSGDSSAAATFNVSFYKNGAGTAVVTKSDAIEDTPVRQRIFFSFKSLQIGLDNFAITKPFKFQGIYIKTIPKEL